MDENRKSWEKNYTIIDVLPSIVELENYEKQKREEALRAALNNKTITVTDENWEDICIDIVNIIINSYYMEFPKPNSATLFAFN